MFSFDEIKNADIEIAEAMQDEMDRQQSHLELIASENIVSKAVMAAMWICWRCRRTCKRKSKEIIWMHIC